MINKYYDQDCNLGMLDGKTVAIIGFGSQGHAHAMNLKESGVDVVVGLRPGSAHVAKAEAAGLKVLGIEEAAEAGNVVMMLVPDELAPAIYKNQIAKHMKEGDTLMFAHGFNIHYSQIQPADYLDVSMVAPKGPGHIVRSLYTQGSGVPCLIAVEQDNPARQKNLHWLMQQQSVQAEQAFWKQPSRKKQKQTCLGNRQFCAAVFVS